MKTIVHDNGECVVHIPAGRIVLEGKIGIPEDARGIVVFPNVGGSIRCNGQNHFIASELRKKHLATLLVNLLALEEEIVDITACHLRYNVRLLSGRLVKVLDWLGRNALAERNGVCFFSAGVAAAAALTVAVRKPAMINSIVLRAGRIDLADEMLSLLRAPALFLVGENDFSLIDISREAQRKMGAGHRLEILPGLERNFEKTTALKEAAHRAAGWFRRNLAVEARRQPPAEEDGAENRDALFPVEELVNV